MLLCFSLSFSFSLPCLALWWLVRPSRSHSKKALRTLAPRAPGATRTQYARGDDDDASFDLPPRFPSHSHART
uniref:Putative secreted peptide n=1 Tax=Anopheles braziliensis TaxID=58242 RepID=A0A2M3ZUQ2_9DIPT